MRSIWKSAWAPCWTSIGHTLVDHSKSAANSRREALSTGLHSRWRPEKSEIFRRGIYLQWEAQTPGIALSSPLSYFIIFFLSRCFFEHDCECAWGSCMCVCVGIHTCHLNWSYFENVANIHKLKPTLVCSWFLRFLQMSLLGVVGIWV